MSKRRPQQELHSFDEPAAKTKRRRGARGSDEYEYEYNLDIAQTDKQNTNDGASQDGNDTNTNTNTNTNTISDGVTSSVWNEEQHKNFVSSIFKIGLKNASPAIILENMTHKNVETVITSERVKSKLQKYRSNKNNEKSKQEFMTNYDEFLERIKSVQAATAANGGGRPGGASASSDPVLSKLLEDIGSSNSGNNKQLLLGGDVAGYLTYCVMKENKEQSNKNCVEGKSSANNNRSSSCTSSAAVLPTNVLQKGAREYVDNYAGCAMQFPILTEIEKKSSLGIAMTFIAGLFLTMSQHLTRERARAETIGLKLLSSTKSISNDADIDIDVDVDASDDETAPKNT